MTLLASQVRDLPRPTSSKIYFYRELQELLDNRGWDLTILNGPLGQHLKQDKGKGKGFETGKDKNKGKGFEKGKDKWNFGRQPPDKSLFQMSPPHLPCPRSHLVFSARLCLR